MRHLDVTRGATGGTSHGPMLHACMKYSYAHIMTYNVMTYNVMTYDFTKNISAYNVMRWRQEEQRMVPRMHA